MDRGRTPGPRKLAGMLIQLDVDGCVADFVGGCLKVMRGMGFHFTHDDITEWDTSAVLHEEQRPEFWRRVKLHGFCYDLAPIRGGVEAVTTLRGAGHEVRFLTAAMPGADNWREERLRWIDHHIGGGHQSYADRVTFAHDKHEHPGDILVDDKPEHITAWLGTGRPAILIDQPYNRGVALLAPRARDIRHAAEIILARAW